MTTGSVTTIVPQHVPGWELLQPPGAAAVGTERGRALAAAAHSRGWKSKLPQLWAGNRLLDKGRRKKKALEAGRRFCLKIY